MGLASAYMLKMARKLYMTLFEHIYNELLICESPVLTCRELASDIRNYKKALIFYQNYGKGRDYIRILEGPVATEVMSPSNFPDLAAIASVLAQKRQPTMGNAVSIRVANTQSQLVTHMVQVHEGTVNNKPTENIGTNFANNIFAPMDAI
jgi:hypothetical protein